MKTASGINPKQNNLQNNYKFTIPYIGREIHPLISLKDRMMPKSSLLYKSQFPSKTREISKSLTSFLFIYLEISFQSPPGELGCVQVCTQVQELLFSSAMWSIFENKNTTISVPQELNVLLSKFWRHISLKTKQLLSK